MKTTFNQNFILRKAKSQPSALATVYLRMTVDGSRIEFSLQRQCDPEKWIPEKGRLNGKTEDVKSFNSYLQRVECKIYDIFQDFISSGIEFDGERIKARYLGFDVEKPKMFLDIYEDHNKEFQELVGRGLSYGTLQKYKTIKGYVAEFLKLRVAIENKFSYVVESTSNGGDAQTMEKQRRDLTKEYIDKLFIFSLKLGPLDADESGDIFDKIVKDQFVRDAAPVADNTNQSESSGATIKSPVVEQGANNPVEELEQSSQPKQDTISITTEKLEKPPERHIKLFKSKLRLVSNSTPRKLRILFYRYLFARNLLIQHQSDHGNNYWLEGEAHGLFIERLIHFSQEDIKEISEEKRRMYLPVRETNLSLENGSAVPASEYKTLLDIFETTIAY